MPKRRRSRSAKMWVRGAPLIGAVGRLRPGARARPRRLRRGAREGARSARRHTADGGQPALGARPRARRGRALPRARTRRRRVARSRRDRREDVAINHAIGLHGLAAAARHRARARTAGAGHDPLQRRRARDLRLGHRDRAAVPRARRGTPVHVWVSETRPRLQGANLTAWEMRRAASRTRCSSTARARC